MDQLTLGKILMKVNELPFLPTITNRIIELTEDPRSTTNQICDVMCQDHVLVSKALKMVNSAYYGFPRRVVTITEAVTMLGMDTLRTLVIGASVSGTLVQASGIKSESLWRHSAACAAAARILATRMGIAEKEHAFIAGLLHDLGKIILLSFMTGYQEIMNKADSSDSTLYETELEFLDFNHTDVGKIAAQKWSFPELLVTAIGYHHDSCYQGSYEELVSAVHLANAVAKMAGYGTGLPEKVCISRQVLARSSMNYEDLCNIADEIKGKISIDFM